MAVIKLLAGIGLFATAAHASFSAPARVPYLHPRSYYESHVDLAAPERARIQAHLAETEARLRANPPAGLTPAQMKNRLARLDDLHAYWLRGEFPKNLDFPDRLVPYFIDAAGVPCAMGYLVIQSGGMAFAEEIRGRMNNAYIAEIAAADARLAAWTEANGMTLDEAAMVQPGYDGPYSLLQMTGLGLGNASRLWVLGKAYSLIAGGAPRLSYRDAGGGWQLDSIQGSEFSTLCMRGTEPLVVSSRIKPFYWRGTFAGTLNGLSNEYPTACAWSSVGVLWVGTARSLTRFDSVFSRNAVYDSTHFGLQSRSVTVIAATSARIWIGTMKGFASATLLSGTPSTWQAWDSTTLGGSRVTGLKTGGGDTVWVGVNGPPSISWWNDPGAPRFFSGKGLLRRTNAGWTIYRANVLTSDSIQALASAGSGSVWLALSSGFYKFTPPSGLQKVANSPLTQYSGKVQILEMIPDGSGGFYAGTDNGLYRFASDSLGYSGYPVTSLRAVANGRPGTLMPLRIELFPQNGASRAHTLLGRKTDSRPATGVYVMPIESR